MVKKLFKIQQAIALAIVLAMIAPVGVLAKDGKKHFKEGMKYEENRQWDKAAEQFALAVAEKPSNVEYQLHLQRSLVNAAIMLVERGDMLAEKKDFNAAYQAYRQAYAFDPANELALIKMRRMLEAQGLPTNSIPDYHGPKRAALQEGQERGRHTQDFLQRRDEGGHDRSPRPVARIARAQVSQDRGFV